MKEVPSLPKGKDRKDVTASRVKSKWEIIWISD